MRTPTGRLTSPRDANLPYGHPLAPWFLASHLIVQLAGCTRNSSG
jgi:hypothetical protein